MLTINYMGELVTHLIELGVLRSPNIIDAFRNTDRKDFVLPEYQKEAYEDYPLPIGYGQTISQPYTVAFMLELLQPQEGEKILDVGSGSGWTTALLAQIVGSKGCVYGMEIIPYLVTFGQNNLKKYKFPHAKILHAGKEFGLPAKAPFEKILTSAAADTLPQELIRQLAMGGTLVIPVRDEILQVHKISETKTDVQKFPGFVFVPLIE